MGTHQRTLAALDAVFRHPPGHHGRHAPLLVPGGGGGHQSRRVEHAYRQAVTLLGQNGSDVPMEVVVLRFPGRSLLRRVQPGGGDIHLHQRVPGTADGLHVPPHHVLALFGKGRLRVPLHQRHRLVVGQRAGQAEERRQHDGADPLPQAARFRQTAAVQQIQPGFLPGQLPAHPPGEPRVQLSRRPGAVQQEDAALLQAGNHVVLPHVHGVVAGHIIRMDGQVRAVDGFRAEAQMADRQPAGLAGIVGKEGLHMAVCLVADELDRPLAGPHRAV